MQEAVTVNRKTKPIINPDELNSLLNEQRKAFLLESDLPGQKVYLKFAGYLNGKAVVWNACIRTIKENSINHQVTDDPQQFIEICVIDGAHFLQVGLNVAEIDQSVIEGTIIMIRNYKRLCRGRHEYGARSKTL